MLAFLPPIHQGVMLGEYFTTCGWKLSNAFLNRALSSNIAPMSVHRRAQTWDNRQRGHCD